VPKKKNLSLTFFSEKILVDGRDTESCWKNLKYSGSFHQNFPYDTSLAFSKTYIKAGYDAQQLYFFIYCQDTLAGKNVIQSLRRDYGSGSSDAIEIYLDPFEDKTNGFYFALNHEGVQAEGLISSGGNFGGSNEWDNRWKGAVSSGTGYWTAEFAIPFKSLRFGDGKLEWGVNFTRYDLKRNETSVWNKVPRNFSPSALAYAGSLVFPELPKKAGLNASVIPFTTFKVYKDNQNPELSNQTVGAGGDVKLSVTSSLNLDLTFNPDFSQVEVDRQVTNLSRFSLFFPERRQFFIENSDLFGQFGFKRIRPFFSRRIGLANGKAIPIIAGARLSGKVNPKWRIGVMDIMTDKDQNPEISAQNYFVGAVQRQLFKASNIAAILVNRQGFDRNGPKGNDYNRVLGLDYNLASVNNTWKGKAFYHRSFSPDIPSNGSYAHAVWLRYSTPKWNIDYNHEVIGENYEAETGFVVRKNVVRFEDYISRTFYPKGKKINNHGPSVYSDIYTSHSGELLDALLNFSYDLGFQNSAYAGTSFYWSFTKLLYPFDASGSESIELPIGKYQYITGSAYFGTNRRKKINANAGLDLGSYFNGTKQSFNANFNYRIQPYGQISLSVSQDRITLPYPYGKSVLTLAGPKIDLSFSKSLFFTAFFQYNTQIKNFNINTRLQWRFRPMSDLYLVYTDNYVLPEMGNLNKAIVLKLNYWLTI